MSASRPPALLLLGASGQLGTDLARALAPAFRLVAVPRTALDVTDAEATARMIAEHAPAWVVNATAYNRVDDAEADPGPAFRVNAMAPHHLALACAGTGARLVHFSTDYVFGGGGPGPFDEAAPPAPLGAYGASKLAGEQLVLAAAAGHLVIRSAGLYGLAGSRGKGGNFVETMLRLAGEGRPIRVVDDQVLTPTPTADLALATARLLALEPAGGVYHLTCAGACSWFEFAGRIFALTRLAPALTPITSAAFGAAARRPANSVLVNTRAAALGVTLRPWPEALASYLAARAARAGRSAGTP